MTTVEFWPDLARAWEATSNSESASLTRAADSVSDVRWRRIKDESRARVLWLEADGFAPAVCKIYRTPPRLAWRTFGLASRANREFTVMMEAHRLGLPVVRPRYWLERRIRGCVEFCAVILDAIDGPDLHHWLDHGDGDPGQRRRMAEATGRLLGRFHRAGLFWGTVSPRNLLMPRDGAESLLAIDMPYARLHGHDISGDSHAMTDLGSALLLSDGRLAFDEREREALMLGYCEGDSERAQSLNATTRLLSHKEWKRQRFLRRLSNLLSPATRSAGRGGIYSIRTNEYRPIVGETVFLGQPND